MGNVVFNIAKGRTAELANRVNANDPTDSAFIVALLDANAVSDATFIDYDTFAALFAGAANEITNGDYVRKTVTSVTVTTDDTNDRVDVTIADQTWTGVDAGDSIEDLLVGYDGNTGAGDDTNIAPLTLHDFVSVPDGSDITADFPADAFFRAS